jgi:hypothetical protein
MVYSPGTNVLKKASNFNQIRAIRRRAGVARRGAPSSTGLSILNQERDDGR